MGSRSDQPHSSEELRAGADGDSLTVSGSPRRARGSLKLGVHPKTEAELAEMEEEFERREQLVDEWLAARRRQRAAMLAAALRTAPEPMASDSARTTIVSSNR
mmetsp:Transcript_33921/g.97660  ORF Transcript_33921/g.97660 Transcript_33921/m.97660 type:complete len:103 (-) Transcript_33921:282-590(-)